MTTICGHSACAQNFIDTGETGCVLLYNAVLAGLRLLQKALDDGEVTPNDGDIGDILTNSGSHPGLTAEEIDNMCLDIDGLIMTSDQRLTLQDIRRGTGFSRSVRFVQVSS